MRENLRRWWAIVSATALEMSSEPLAFLLTLSAAVTVALTSAFHFHQFGEPSRMARDAGLSAILIFGLFHAVFCTIKVFRREIESGTAQMALSRPISRAGFFLSKVVGSCLSSFVFAATILCVALTTIVGAEVGGCIAVKKGELATIWGLSLAVDAAVVLIPLIFAAVMNRFCRARFSTTATFTCLVCALIAAGLNLFLANRFGAAHFADLGFDFGLLIRRVLPAAVAVFLPIPVFVTASAAFAVKFKDHAAASSAGLLFLVALPALSNYYLSDALAKGGSLPWSHVGLTALAILPFAAAFALLGLQLFKDRDVG